MGFAEKIGMEKKISEFEGRVYGFEGGTGWLHILVGTTVVRNEGAIDVTYCFPLLCKIGEEICLDEYRGKRVEVTVEVLD